jgi:hypothetical protein
VSTLALCETPINGLDRAEFDRWYSSEQEPKLRANAQWEAALRGWSVRGEPAHLAVHFLEGRSNTPGGQVQALAVPPPSGAAHAEPRLLEGSEIADSGVSALGQYLYLITFAVPPVDHPEFDNWYGEEHVPILLRSQYWLRCRRYGLEFDTSTPAATRAILYELSDLAALEAPELPEARSTTWRQRISEMSWYATARFSLYERHQNP